MGKIYKRQHDKFIRVNLKAEFLKILSDMQKKDEDISGQDIEDAIDFLGKGHLDFKNNIKEEYISSESSHSQPDSKKYQSRKNQMKIFNLAMEAMSVFNADNAYVEIDDFDRIYNEFQYRIKKISRHMDDIDEFKNALHKLSLKKTTDEKKMQVFINILLREYDKNIYTENKDHHDFLTGIKRFMYDIFGIELGKLPDELKGSGKLTLYSLLLNNNKQNKVIINDNLPVMTGENLSYKASPSNKDKLIWEFKDYLVRLENRPDSIYEILFVPHKYYRDPKINVTRQMIRAIERDEKLALSDDELVTLREGELGEIFDKCLQSEELREYIPYNMKPGGGKRIKIKFKEVLPDLSDTNINSFSVIAGNKSLFMSNETYVFHNVVKNFSDAFNKDNSLSDIKKSIVNSFNKIYLRKIKKEKKFEKLADMLIYQYSKLLLSGNEDNMELAKVISGFCKKHLGINLPKKLNNDKPLTLATLILEDKERRANEEPKYIQSLFARLINRPKLLNTFTLNEDDHREKFILLLREYETIRANEGESTYGLLFGRDRRSKLNVVKQLKHATRHKTDTAFNNDEMKVINDARLRDIIIKFSHPSVIPPQVRNIRHDRDLFNPKKK